MSILSRSEIRADFAESALIYVAQNNTYLSSNTDLMSGKGVNDDASMSFEAGKSYRVRIINMAALASESHISRLD